MKIQLLEQDNAIFFALGAIACAAFGVQGFYSKKSYEQEIIRFKSEVEKFQSLKQSTKDEIATALQEINSLGKESLYSP